MGNAEQETGQEAMREGKITDKARKGQIEIQNKSSQVKSRQDTTPQDKTTKDKTRQETRQGGRQTRHTCLT